MINQLKHLLTELGLKIVDEELPSNEYGRSDANFVVSNGEKYFKVSYSADSYGDEVSFDNVKEVKPTQVTKTEYL